jgi:hypothetical protein
VADQLTRRICAVTTATADQQYPILVIANPMHGQAGVGLLSDDGYAILEHALLAIVHQRVCTHFNDRAES